MGTIYTVSSSEELYEALANAQGGDEIQLASGDYGDLTLDSKSGFDITFDAEVTITSQDASAPATFSSMTLNGVSNLTFDNVIFDYTFQAGDESFTSPFEVLNSSYVEITNSLFDGDVASGVSEIDDGYGIGVGLFVRGSDNITMSDNESVAWHRAAVFTESTNLTVSGNDIHSIRSDGLNFSEVQGVLIEDNYIHDFMGAPDSADHMDMIQFWTNGTDQASTDIVIRNNTLDVGDGTITQSIFMRNDQVDQGYAGEELFYQNVLIEGNTIINGHTHGITIGETDGLTIQNNTILSIDPSDDRYFGAPAINMAPDSKSVVIKQNAVAAINDADGSEFTVSNNAFIQNSDPNGVGYYADIFVESSQHGSVADYVIAPGSMLDQLGAGAPQNALDSTPDALTAGFDVFSSADQSNTLVFDAGYTFDASGQVGADEASFVWDFGDGTIFEGVSGSHSYAEAGVYDVTLTVTLDGTSTVSTAYAEIKVAGDDILAFDAASGAFKTQAYADEEVIAGSNAASVSYSGQKAIDLGASGTQLELDETAIGNFFGSDSFEINMTLKADDAGDSWGEIARVHGSFIISVTEEGAFKFQFTSDAGNTVQLDSGDVLVNDGQAHDVTIKLDGDTDTLMIMVDGDVAGTVAMYDSVAAMGNWGLVFGNPWGKQNFDGKVLAFDMDAESRDYPTYDGPVGELTELANNTPEPETPETETPSESEETASLPSIDDYVLDAGVLSVETLGGTASVIGAGTEEAHFEFNGKTDYVDLGRLEDFEETDELSFAVTFSKANADDGDMRLVWNHMHVGLGVEEDGLRLFVGQNDAAFHKSIMIDDIGLNDTEQHEAIVIIEDNEDRVQVILDDQIVFDETGTRDLELTDTHDGQWGWTLGSAWNRDFEGEIYELRIDAEAEFVPSEDALVGV